MMEKYTVDEIKKILQQDVVDEAFVERLKSDERSGVQKLVKQYENKCKRNMTNSKNLLPCRFMKMSFAIVVLN